MFENERVLITGAASGIGYATAAAAAARGAEVWALDIQEGALGELSGVRYEQCDVGRLEDWQRIAGLLEATGAPRFVHLNAGIQIAPPDAPLREYQFDAMTIERYRRMMSVNVDGVVFGLRALLPLLEPGARIVVTSSLAGVAPYDVDPLYAMSKHAVSGLVRSLAPTLVERDIKLNAICPGGIDTAIIPHEQRNPKAMFMSPAHVADEVLYLMGVAETGKTWAKVAEDKPVFIVRAPGDKRRDA